MKRLLGFVLLLIVTTTPLLAVEPDEVLKDPRLEERARTLSSELRCLVCQNQSIDDSHAPLARDLRVLVRQKLVVGDSDDAIRTFLVDRYGEFILLKPRFSLDTLVLWITPFALLVFGGVMLLRTSRRSTLAKVEALDRAEEARLNEFLKTKDQIPS